MKKIPTNTILYYFVLFTLILFSLGPIILMFVTSFKLKVDILSDSSAWFFMPTLQNYAAMLDDRSLVNNVSNSLYVAIVSTGITLLAGCMAAYAIVRYRFWGRDTVSMTTLIMRMVPPAVLLVPVFGIWTFDYEIDGTLNGIVLIYTAMNLPFVIWILQSFIQQIPIQLEEAARMDGANPFQVFYHIILPVIQPGLAAASIFTFRIAWNEFLIANAISDRSTRTTPVYIVNSLTEYNIDWGAIMAMGVLLAIPPIIFTFVASKQIISGMTAGAVKG
ncbi:carbohydrate ABC transporter permease [Veronia pacifica]|uniref:Sugar ABC transporter permease n=1 Tax=Veronia pacifica TaxID=1080227 RepID=A0A1C3EF11_9GAMM|nr:carbohydrate ABC transporter permease [Veronia pacifica]ODA31784.1 sugar ABC transporter permease [Veronia pacifica]